nr:MAG TPA: head closure knob [Caudoviricetes sp.]
MVSALERARKGAQSAQSMLYDGRADIIEYRKQKDPESGITSYKEEAVERGLPCRLSFSEISSVSQTDSAADTAQVIKLFLAPDAAIKPGSKIIVTQNGKTVAYQCSGVPAVYATHQEIILTLFQKWS